ncbi:unnamed protein product [Musa acuminata subsp. malaccensis]|uniref:(wild Malaysian banana) hypothetical protein n=1 Tax=Musa acuminata subsp. malaccensis TaxID=214687 RepID=A0A804IDH0_MUSAM|nr:PREDICTED: chaperone protein dnaJ 8, chloroplastic isoform X2 [Musa acuminata subsp. malaccensis]CAG1850561.1 unnamed protein product [Musa acuminata subsp. malaccensis]
MRRAATPRALGNGPMGRFPAARLANGGRCLRIPARSLPIADEFAALGLTPFASRCDVKRAYKRLALKYHPDVVRGDNGGGEKDETFREIKSAYESLMAKFEEESNSDVVDGYGDEWDEWDEWMGFEGGFPVVCNPS